MILKDDLIYKMDVSSLSLSLYIIELSNKFSILNQKEKIEYLSYIKDEFFAIDDEFSQIFEIIINILIKDEKIEIKLSKLYESLNINLTSQSTLDESLFKLELCIKSCIDYLPER